MAYLHIAGLKQKETSIKMMIQGDYAIIAHCTKMHQFERKGLLTILFSIEGNPLKLTQ